MNSLSDHSSVKSELRIKKLTLNHTTTWTLNDYWVNNKIKAEINKFFATNRNKDTMYRLSETQLKQCIEGNL